MAIINVRINFGLSEFLREWVTQQIGFIAILEQSTNHFTVQFDLTGPQATALKTAFHDKLIEVL